MIRKILEAIDEKQLPRPGRGFGDDEYFVEYQSEDEKGRKGFLTLTDALDWAIKWTKEKSKPGDMGDEVDWKIYDHAGNEIEMSVEQMQAAWDMHGHQGEGTEWDWAKLEREFDYHAPDAMDVWDSMSYDDQVEVDEKVDLFSKRKNPLPIMKWIQDNVDSMAFRGNFLLRRKK